MNLFGDTWRYLVDPEKVRDKDGISAAADFLALAGELAADDHSIGAEQVDEAGDCVADVAAGIGDHPLARLVAFERQVDEALLRVGRVKEGDLLVIIAGSPPGIPGSTNALRIHRMGDAINEVAPAYRSHR